MQRKYVTWTTILLIGLAFVFLFIYNPLITFSTKTKIIIHPSEEWELTRTIDGNLVSIHKNHLTNSVKNFAVNEFQRGDAVRFVLNTDIFEKKFVNSGDTIGYVYSNEEQLRLIQLKGQIGILNSELEFHTTGQKPEDVDFAKRNLDLALQELETQKKLMVRSQELIADNVISKEQYDIDVNELKVKEMRVELAKANLASVDTGEKPEMEKLVRSKIEAITWQIDQIQSRLALLTVIAPISGRIVIDHGSMLIPSTMITTETIVKIVDDSNPIGLMPIRLKHCSAVAIGAHVKFSRSHHTGSVIFTNNTAQISLSAPYVYYVVQLKKDVNYAFGEIQDVEVTGSKVPFIDYLNLHLSH